MLSGHIRIVLYQRRWGALLKGLRETPAFTRADGVIEERLRFHQNDGMRLTDGSPELC
jgi:hypothetical protein